MSTRKTRNFSSDQRLNAYNENFETIDTSLTKTTVERQITDGEIDGYTYHRDDNPTVRAVEKKMAALEQAEDCIICTSGMAACTMVYLTYLNAETSSSKKGDETPGVQRQYFGANTTIITDRTGAREFLESAAEIVMQSWR